MKTPIWPFAVNMAFWIIIALCIVLLTGCQTAAQALDGAHAIRGEIAKKELEIHVRGVCGANFNVIRAKYGKDDQSWNAILAICESGKNSTQRKVDE